MERKSKKYVNEIICLAKNIPDVTININKHTVNELIVNRVLKECQTPLFYHKFVIHKARSYERNYILKSIMDFVYPSTLMPVHFSQSYTQSSSCFLARNCLEVIIKIMNQKCQIPHRLDPEKPFNVIILANSIVSEEVPVEDNTKNIQEVIEKRFKKETKMLDLNNFSDDIDLNEYVPLFNQKFFHYIINQGAEMAPEILDLQNNYIRDISSISVLKTSIQVLDLSNNEIEDINVLSGLTEFANLKNLSLTGNPMCDLYDSYNYVMDVMRYCPNLEKLDGVDITTPEFKKNFMCTAEAKDLAAHFIQYYFTNYDSSNREALKYIYDPLAIFSVNATIKPNQKNSTTVKINHYGLENPYVVVGIVDIMKLFQEFPESCHDPYPTVCDVNIYTDTHAQLVVCGIFKELSQVLSFNRSFYFKRNGQQFIITNEQLHVSNALDYQVGWSFRFPADARLTGTPLPYFYEQYKELEELLRKLTNMNLEYCQKYLVYCNYDLKKALTLFSELHINNEVPQEAFVKESGAVINKQQSPICVALQKKISKKQNYISLKTIWETLNSERLESSISDPPVIMNPTINKLYKKPIALPPNLNISQSSTDIAHPSSSFMNTFNKIDIKDKSNLISITRKPLSYGPAKTFVSTQESSKSFATSSTSEDLRNIKIVEDEGPPDKSHSESSTNKNSSKFTRKSRFDERPDNSSAKTSSNVTNKIAFSLKLPPENKKVQDPLQEHAARMAEYKEMALKKIAELRAKTTNNPDTSSRSNSQNPSKVKSGQVQPSPKTTQQPMVYNEVPPPSLYKSKIGSANKSNKRTHTSVNLPSQPAKKPKITVEVAPPNPVLSSKALKQIQATKEFCLQVMKNASIPIQEKREQQNITSPPIDANTQTGKTNEQIHNNDDISKIRQNLQTSPSIHANTQSGKTNEQILNNDDISKIRQNLQTSPSIDAKTQSGKTNEQILNNDDISKIRQNLQTSPPIDANTQTGKTNEQILKNEDISKIRQNLQKEKEKLVLLKNQFDATINSGSSSKSKPNAIRSAASTTSIGSLSNADDISKQEVIKDMRQKLQQQKEKLMELKKHLDTTISSKNSKPSTTPTPPQNSKDSNKSIKSTPPKASPDKIEQNSAPSAASTSSVPTLASSDDIGKQNLTQKEQAKKEDLQLLDKLGQPSVDSTCSAAVQSSNLMEVENVDQSEQAMSVDEIVEAVSKKGRWDDRLKRALQALRPPDKPYGRIRQRIFGTDGRRVQVWLPRISVLTEAKKEDLHLLDKPGQPSVDSTCSAAVQSSNLMEVENVDQSEQAKLTMVEQPANNGIQPCASATNNVALQPPGLTETTDNSKMEVIKKGKWRISNELSILEEETETTATDTALPKKLEARRPRKRIRVKGKKQKQPLWKFMTADTEWRNVLDKMAADVERIHLGRKNTGQNLQLMKQALEKSTENVSATEEDKETATNTGQNLQDENQISVNLELKSENSASGIDETNTKKDEFNLTSVKRKRKRACKKTRMSIKLMWQAFKKSTENVSVTEEDLQFMWQAFKKSRKNVSVTEEDKETTTNTGQNLQFQLIWQAFKKSIENVSVTEEDLQLMKQALEKSAENVSVTEEDKETTTNSGQNLQLITQALEKSTENVSVTEEDKETTTNSGQNLQLMKQTLEKSTENVSVTEEDKETTTNSGQNLQDENQISVNLKRKSENSASVPSDIDDSGTSKDITIKEGENVTVICSATGHPEPRILCRGEEGGHLITQTGPQEAQKGIDETNAKKDEFNLTSVKRKKKRLNKKKRMARKLMYQAFKKSTENVSVTEEDLQFMWQAFKKSRKNVSVTEEDKETTTNIGQNLKFQLMWQAFKKSIENVSITEEDLQLMKQALEKSTENVSVTEEDKETATNTGQNLQLMKQALEKSTENVSATEEDKETTTNTDQNLQLMRLKHPEDPNSVIALDKSTENVSVTEEVKESTTHSGQNLQIMKQALEKLTENVSVTEEDKETATNTGENLQDENQISVNLERKSENSASGLDEANAKKDEFNLTSVKRKKKRLNKKKRMARKFKLRALEKQALEKSTENVSVTEEDTDTGQNRQLMKQQEEDKETSGFNDQTKLDDLSNVNKTPNFSKKLHISITRLPEKESLLSVGNSVIVITDDLTVNNSSQDSNLKILHSIKSNIEIRLTKFEQITEKCSRTEREKKSKNSDEETLQGLRNEIENASIVQVDAEKHVGGEKQSNCIIENQSKNFLKIEESNSTKKPEKIQPCVKKCVETQSQNLNTEILRKEKSNIQAKSKNTEPSQPSIKILQTIESDNGIKSKTNEVVKNVKLKEINSEESIKTMQNLESNNESKSQTSEVFKKIKLEETNLASEEIIKSSIANTNEIQNINEENVPSTLVLKTIANIKQEIPSTVKEEYFSNSNQSTSTAVTISFQGNKKPVDLKPGTPIQGTSTTKDRKSDIQLEKNPQDIKKVGSSETSIKKEPVKTEIATIENKPVKTEIATIENKRVKTEIATVEDKPVKTEIATIENKPVMKEISFLNVCPSSSSDDDDILPLKLFD